MADKIFGVGVVGCGGISGVHIPVLLNLPGVELRAVCDIRPERAASAAERSGAAVAESFEALIARDDIDAVHLCTPHYLHAPMAIAALRAGKHVLSEKPMATTLEDARAMIAAAEAPGAGRLGIIFQNRYNPATQALKAIIASGKPGRFLGARANVCWHREAPYYTESGWRGSLTTEGGGVLINQAIHTLDLLSYIGGPIARVRGHISTDLLEGIIEVEDNCHAVFEYTGGQKGVIQLTNNYVADAPILLEAAFENATYQLLGEKLYEVTGGEMRLIERGEAPALSEKAYWGASHGLQIADFYNSLRTGRPIAVDARSAYPALNLVKAIQASSTSGEWVELDRDVSLA